MKLLRYDAYRDGGSLSLFTDQGEYVVNKAFGAYGEDSKKFYGRVTKGYDNEETPKPSADLADVAQLAQLLDAQADEYLHAYAELIRKFYGARIAPRNDNAWIKDELIRS